MHSKLVYPLLAFFVKTFCGTQANIAIMRKFKLCYFNIQEAKWLLQQVENSFCK